MNSGAQPVTVTILDKDYQIACKASERDALVESASYLNKKMREIRDSGRVVGLDRIAVIAALNITNEFLGQKSSNENITTDIGTRIASIQSKIDAALSSTNQLEL